METSNFIENTNEWNIWKLVEVENIPQLHRYLC